MKKQLKKALISVFAFSLALSSAMIPNTPVSSLLTAEITADAAETYGQVKYAGNTFNYETTGNGTAVKLTSINRLNEATCPLPSSVTVNGKSLPVNEIANDFGKNAVIRTITIPDSVKKVGYNFAAGSKIESIGVGMNVKEIGINLCQNCPNLRTVSYYGTALEKLGEHAFNGTPYIQNKNSKGAVTMGEWLIQYTGTASSVRVLDLGNNRPDIHKIAPYAFSSNTKLQSVNLNGISVVGEDAFRSCSNLKTITDGYSLSSVESRAFSTTPWFDAQKAANGGTVVLDRALLNYTKITNNTVDMTNLNVQYIAADALRAVKNAKTVKLPNSILSVDRYAFCVSNEMADYENLYLFNQKITYSNYNSSQYANFMKNNLAAFTHSKWGINMAREKGKSILSSLGIAYVGNGSKGNYSVEKEYEIVNKLYHHVGGKHQYRYSFDGGSQDYIEELFYNKGIICYDYADLYMFLLELAGVDAECVSGPGHAFNTVEIGGDWFFVDTCWYNYPNLYLVNRATVEQEKKNHIVNGLSKHTMIPSEMFTLSGIPYCKYTLGDVNRDGQFDIRDAATFREYLLGTRTLNAKQKILSDVNKDGKFDKTDLKVMCDANHVGSRRVGDVNGDGKINTDDAVKLQKYILGAQSLDEQSYYASDVLLDGTVDVYDLTLEKRLVIYPMGDVNMDQKINTADVTAITKFMNKTGTLTNEGKVRADVNYDGVIDGVDITLIKNMMR